jgi:hypothetical protein
MVQLLFFWFDLACSTIRAILCVGGRIVNALNPSADEVYIQRRNVLWLCRCMNEAEYGEQITKTVSQP